MQEATGQGIRRRDKLLNGRAASGGADNTLLAISYSVKSF